MESIEVITSRPHVIRVNALEFAQICGHERAVLFYCGCKALALNEAVKIQLSSENDDFVFGCYVFRYIVDISNRYALQLDDYSCRLTLSPFKPSPL